VRIAFGKNQQSADAAAVQKDETEPRFAFGLPAFFRETLQSCSHGFSQVGAGFEARAFDDFPLQVEENNEPNRLGADVDIVAIAHGGSFANRESPCLFSSGGGGVLYKKIRRRLRGDGMSRQAGRGSSLGLQ
jgi:hypothetical protein